MNRHEFLKTHGLEALDFNWETPQIRHQGVATLDQQAKSQGLRFLSHSTWLGGLISSNSQVKLSDIDAKHRGVPSTISFMYNITQCGRDGSRQCPSTATALEMASQKNPSMHHYIVAVWPDDLKGDLQRQLDAFPHLKGHYTVIYPVQQQNDSRGNPIFALPAQVQNLANKLGLPTGGSDYQMHSGSIAVYGAAGTRVARVGQASDPSSMADAIIKAVTAAPQKQGQHR